MENIVENASKAGATAISVTDKVVGSYVVTTFSDNGRGCACMEKIGTGYTEGGTGHGTQMIKKYMSDMGGDAHWDKNSSGGVSVVLRFRVSSDLAKLAA